MTVLGERKRNFAGPVVCIRSIGDHHDDNVAANVNSKLALDIMILVRV